MYAYGCLALIEAVLITVVMMLVNCCSMLTNLLWAFASQSYSFVAVSLRS